MTAPKCEMPECVGGDESNTVAGRDPSGELIEICTDCLNDGWGSVVTVLEGETHV